MSESYGSCMPSDTPSDTRYLGAAAQIDIRPTRLYSNRARCNTCPKRVALVKSIGRNNDPQTSDDVFAAIYVDRRVTGDEVRCAVKRLAEPQMVSAVTIDDSAPTDIFDCRVVVYLWGSFDAATAVSVPRDYAEALSELLGAPAFCLADLLHPREPYGW